MSQHKLLQLIDQTKPNLQPLNTHYMAQFSIAERQDYAIMLAAVITGTGTVTEAQSRLFGMLLSSMELDNDVASYYKLAQDIDVNYLNEIINNFSNGFVGKSLVFDVLVISSLTNNNLNKLLSEIVMVLNVNNLSEVKECFNFLCGSLKKTSHITEAHSKTYIISKEQFLFRLKSKIYNKQYKVLERDFFKENNIDFFYDGEKVDVLFEDNSFSTTIRKNCKFVVNINALNKAGFNIDGKYNFLLDSGERTVKRNIYMIPIEFSAWSEFFKVPEVKK
ncbi:hypothetical protein [Photobacterium leiognathi]|uniref:hypothetical protein n=1 Tax=Photobacterium leiognathi TaxID=553611 RepID=UPI0029814E32|nr:hypothetical protein [Photobacterium leiognathi]